jgi:hypothetical protein
MRRVLVKLAFVLDCTASMQPWIHEAKTKIHEIINSNRNQYPFADFEIALVAYRDHGDDIRFRIVDFSDPERIVDTLRNVQAEGGQDEAEDIAGALERTTNLTWGPSDVRLLFHIADAPAHGEKFHTINVSDNYSQGDPDGKDPCDSLVTLAELNVEYTFVRINKTTDKMTTLFHEIYTQNDGRFALVDLHPQSYRGEFGRVRDENMAGVLSPAVTQSVSRAISRYTSSQDT